MNKETTLMQPLTTIAEAKKHLDKNKENGATCPCCGQVVKTYFRRLNGTMAYALFMFNQMTGGDIQKAVHLQNEMRARYLAASDFADFAKLRFWDLIAVDKNNVNEKGNPRGGYYRITKKGIAFLKGELQLHTYAKLFNNQFYGHDGEMLTFKQALGSKFDYEELMNGNK